MNIYKEKRIALGLSQKDVASALAKVDSRIDVGMVSRFENNVCVPTDDVRKAYERYLQIDESEVCGEDGKVCTEKENGAETVKAPSAEVLLVTSAIPVGAANAIKRSELCKLLEMGDRYMRIVIAQARECGYMILNSQDGRGYYISDDLKEIYEQYKQDTSRALSILSRRKYMRRVLKEAGYPV